MEEKIIFDAVAFEEVFPFSFIVDSQSKIVTVGRSSRKLIPEVKINHPIQNYLKLVNSEPLTQFVIEHLLSESVTFRVRGSNLKLKGQVTKINDAYFILILSPYFTDISEVVSAGLNFSDFAIFDPIFDFLMLVQSERKAVRNSEESKQRLELENRLLGFVYSQTQHFENNFRMKDTVCDMLANTCQQLDFQIGHAFKVTKDLPPKLESMQIWYSRDVDQEIVEDLQNSTKLIEFRAGIGLPGSAMEQKKSFWMKDIKESKNFPRHTYMQQRQINTGVAVPVLVQGTVVAVLEFFSTKIKDIDQNKLMVLDIIGAQFGRLIERGEYELTLQKRNEDLESAIKSANSANIAKSLFLANMSHEIRTPLNGIIGMASVLSDMQLSSSQKVQLDRLTKSADHLLSLVNDILDFSKIEAGELTLEEITFDLWEFLNDLIEIFREEAEKKNLALALQLSPGLPRKIVGDSHRIRQIIINLIGNAIKFTSSGQVLLKASSEPVNSEGQFALILTVEDTGSGMDQETLGRLFKPFTQGDTSTTRKYGGTGLGLVISKNLAQKMNGDLSAVSELGKGSQFVAIVRVAVSNENIQPITQLTSPADYRPLKILVAEDNEINQEVVRAMFKKINQDIDIAKNGIEAVSKAANHSYDIIFMDCQMPEMDGFNATSKIRASADHFKSRKSPIIAMTANAMKGDRERCIESGMSDYLTKPVKLSNLVSILDKWIVEDRTEVTFDKDALDGLASLQTASNPKFIETQMRAFQSEFLEAIDSFDLCFNGELSMHEVKKVTHKFKTSCGIIGANTLVQLCEEIEATSDQDSQKIIKLVEKLKTLCEEIFPKILNYLKVAI